MSVISEVAQYLVNQGVGTLATDVFYGKLPDTGRDFEVCVIDRSGPAPDIDILEIESPQFQIFIRSKDYATGKAKLDTIRGLLHGKLTQYLVSGGIYFRRIHALSEGGHIGVNDAGRDEFSMNFICEVIQP